VLITNACVESAGIGEYLCWYDTKGGLIEYYGDVKAGRANGLGLCKALLRTKSSNESDILTVT
jgi:hypothetical protein